MFDDDDDDDDNDSSAAVLRDVIKWTDIHKRS